MVEKENPRSVPTVGGEGDQWREESIRSAGSKTRGEGGSPEECPSIRARDLRGIGFRSDKHSRLAGGLPTPFFRREKDPSPRNRPTFLEILGNS